MTSFFHGKIALVTGASSGIGKETALQLGNLGACVALLARRVDALEEIARAIRAQGSQALLLPADVTRSDACRQAVEACVNNFGRIDLLINSAGLSMRANFADSNLEAMEQVMRVNFFGTLYMTHFALPHVKKSKGSLVAISSLTGKRGVPSYALYGASKFAVRGLYEALKLEVAKHGVHVGVVLPAFVGTELRDNVLGPDGTPWKEPPPPPFRIWPVELCVQKILDLIERRRAQVLLPWFTGPMMILDDMVGKRLGDWLLRRRFPPI